MITMNELVDLRMQQHIAHEIYRQQIMQRIPDPFPPLLPIAIPQHVILPPRITLPGVDVTLQNDDLWKEFHQIGTEMIITKNGRRMFPSMRLSLSGLEDETSYCIVLEMVPIADCRYKFSGSQWVPAGGAEPQSPQRIYLHPDSPATGSHWQAQPILFSKVKLTNNTLDTSGHIVLASMHKYQPRIHVIRASDPTQIPWSPQQAFVFPETEFVAVTAYQNDRITKLKIDNNPFAKGFRETGQSRCKRKMSSSPSSEDQDHSQHQHNNHQLQQNEMSPMKFPLTSEPSSICSEKTTTTTTMATLRDLNDDGSTRQIKRIRSNDSGCAIASPLDEINVTAIDETLYSATVNSAGSSTSRSSSLNVSHELTTVASTLNIASNLIGQQQQQQQQQMNAVASYEGSVFGTTSSSPSKSTSSSSFMHHFQQNMQTFLRPSLVDLASSYFSRTQAFYALHHQQQQQQQLQHMYSPHNTATIISQQHDRLERQHVANSEAIMSTAGTEAKQQMQVSEPLPSKEFPNYFTAINIQQSAKENVNASMHSDVAQHRPSQQPIDVSQVPKSSVRKKNFTISAILDGNS